MIVEYILPSTHELQRQHNIVVEHIHIMDRMNYIGVYNKRIDMCVRSAQYYYNDIKHMPTNFDRNLTIIPKDKFHMYTMTHNRVNFKGQIISDGYENRRQWAHINYPTKEDLKIMYKEYLKKVENARLRISERKFMANCLTYACKMVTYR